MLIGRGLTPIGVIHTIISRDGLEKKAGRLAGRMAGQPFLQWIHPCDFDFDFGYDYDYDYDYDFAN